MKRRLMFKNCTDFVLKNKIIVKWQQRFKSDCHNVYTKQINKIALSSNDDKRLQTFDKIQQIQVEQMHSKYDVCESEMLSKYK